VKAGWSETTIGEIARIARGGSPRPILKFLTKDPDGINWIKIGDATKSGKYIFETEEKIIPEGVARSRLVKEGDFLLSNSMSFGRPYIMRTTGCIHDGWLVLTPDLKRVDQDFLYHLLGAPQVYAQFDRLAAGSTVRNLNTSLVSTVRIPLPPLDEQKRIVAFLDETFEGLSRARTNAEANLADARELFGVVHKEALTRHAGGGRKVTMADVTEIASTLVDPKLLEYSSLPHVGAGNMPTCSDQLLDVLSAAEEGLTSGKFLFDQRMVLYSKIRPYLRKASRPDFDGLCSADVYPLLPKAGVLDRDYLFYLLLGPDFTEYAIAGSARAGMPKVNREHLFKYSFELPPLERQREIAALLDEALKEANVMETNYASKRDALDALRQSLLQKAFSGEFT
jgi:type I restriction enzyme S subunit